MSHAVYASTKLSRPRRWQLVVRGCIALVGGFALANASIILLTHLLPMPANEAAMTAFLTSSAIYVGAVLWMFSIRSMDKAILRLLVPTLLVVSFALVLKLSGAAGL